MTPAADTLLGNDSLGRAVERLFVQGARFEPLAAADSVRQALPAATAADLYVPESYPVPGAPLPVPGATPAADSALQAFLLLLGVFYVLLLSNHLGNVYTLFMRATSGTATPHRTPDLRGGSNYVPFLNLAVVVGVLFAGILCMRLAAPIAFAAPVPQLALSLAVSAAFAAILLLQTGMLRLAGAVTLQQEFIAELNGVKRTSLALYSILLPPALLCYALTPVGSGATWIYVILAETAIVLFLFLKESSALFAAKKVSIFHWILYLCIVELFPVSLLWLLIARR